MTVTYEANGIFCLSTDTKPTTGVKANSILYETNTGLIYYWNGTAWSQAGGAPEESAFSYIVYKVGATIKSMNVTTKAILSSGSAAEVVIQATIDACGNDSGKCIHIKNGLYTLAASLNFTAINGYVHILGEHSYQTQLRPSGDFPAMIIAKNGVGLTNLYFTHNQSAYTSSLLQIREPAFGGSYTRVNFYDFGWKAGNGINVSNQSAGTSVGLLKHNFLDCEIYGFNNGIFTNITGGTNNWITNINFEACRCWYPKNAAYKYTGVASGQNDINYFGNFQVNCQTSGANQTVCGFDYDTSGRSIYTTHNGCMIIDLGTGSNYANVNSTTEIMCNGCVPSWKIGGSGVTSHKVTDNGYYGFARGKSTFSGNASTTDFVITHNGGHFLQVVPNIARLTPGSDAAKGTPYVDDSTITYTSMTVKFPVAPPTGTNNIILYWEVSYQS